MGDTLFHWTLIDGSGTRANILLQRRKREDSVSVLHQRPVVVEEVVTSVDQQHVDDFSEKEVDPGHLEFKSIAQLGRTSHTFGPTRYPERFLVSC